MRIVDAKTMQAIDREAMTAYAIPGHKLMEQAGLRLAEHVLGFIGSKSQTRVTILAGGGKNGGDGLVCARYLARAGIKPRVLILSEKIAPETLENLQRLSSENVASRQCSECLPDAFAEIIMASDVVVDAMLGIGLSGDLREPYIQAITKVNASNAVVIAADIPSGLNADNGDPGIMTVQADCTITFGLPKAGLLRQSAASYVGRLVVETIGFPAPLLRAGQAETVQYVYENAIAGFLPKRSPLGHKRSVGKVLVIGGSFGYHGALLLAALGAMRSGAGYVAMAYPKTMDAVIRSHALEAVCLPMADGGKAALGIAALPQLLETAQTYDAVVLGPGLGRTPGTQNLIRRFIGKIAGPAMLLVDADALHALSGVQWPSRSSGRPEIIVTPHEGEAAQLLGKSAEHISSNRMEALGALTKKLPGIVLLKGRNTVIAKKRSPVFITGSGTQALATAGSGDVLGGVIAALAAQKISALQAGLAGAVAHGIAGCLAAKDVWGQGVIARDIADQLPNAFALLRKLPARADWV